MFDFELFSFWFLNLEYRLFSFVFRVSLFGFLFSDLGFGSLDYARSAKIDFDDISSVSRTWIWDRCAGPGTVAQDLLAVNLAQDLDRPPYYIWRGGVRRSRSRSRKSSPRTPLRQNQHGPRALTQLCLARTHARTNQNNFPVKTLVPINSNSLLLTLRFLRKVMDGKLWIGVNSTGVRRLVVEKCWGSLTNVITRKKHN